MIKSLKFSHPYDNRLDAVTKMFFILGIKMEPRVSDESNNEIMNAWLSENPPDEDSNISIKWNNKIPLSSHSFLYWLKSYPYVHFYFPIDAKGNLSLYVDEEHSCFHIVILYTKSQFSKKINTSTDVDIIYSLKFTIDHGI